MPLNVEASRLPASDDSVSTSTVHGRAHSASRALYRCILYQSIGEPRQISCRFRGHNYGQNSSIASPERRMPSFRGPIGDDAGHSQCSTGRLISTKQARGKLGESGGSADGAHQPAESGNRTRRSARRTRRSHPDSLRNCASSSLLRLPRHCPQRCNSFLLQVQVPTRYIPHSKSCSKTPRHGCGNIPKHL